jgi:hypothetical protein
MTKAKPKYDTIAIGRKKIRFKFWLSEKSSGPDKVPYYVGVLTPVKPEMMDRFERAFSRKYQIKGIFYRKT